MDLWEALGVSPQGALLAAAGGLVTACVLAVRVFWKRAGSERRHGLGLEDR
jgi:hypothetical protein